MRHCSFLVSWLPKIFSNIFNENVGISGETSTVEIVGEIIPEHSFLKKMLSQLYLGDTLTILLILENDKVIISTRKYGVSNLINVLTRGNKDAEQQIREKLVQMIGVQINKALPDKKQYVADYNLLLDCVKYRKGVINYLDEKSLIDDDIKSIDYSVEKVIMPWVINHVVKNICFGMVQGGDINNISRQTLIVLHACIEKMIKNYIKKYNPDKSIWVGVALVATRLGLIHLGIDEECDIVEDEFNFTSLSYFCNPQSAITANFKSIFNEIERNMTKDTDFQPCGNILKQTSNTGYTSDSSLPKLKRSYSI